MVSIRNNNRKEAIEGGRTKEDNDNDENGEEK